MTQHALDQQLIQLAAQALSRKDRELLQRLSRQILADHPQHVLGHYFSGKTHEWAGNLQDALAAFETAVSLEPQDDVFFNDWKKTATSLGVIDRYLSRPEIVFVTGSVLSTQGFHAHTPRERALGGSESALIAVARALAATGHAVAVYCNCDKPGMYEGVSYHSNRAFAVSNRLYAPPLLIVARFDRFLYPPTRAGQKILWIQDILNCALYADSDKAKCHFDYLFALSDYQKKDWKETYRLSDSQILVTRNGFEPESFSETDAPKKPQIIFASRPSRGLREALLVFAELRKQRPDLELVIGTYTQEKNLEDDEELKPFLAELAQPGVRFLRGLSKPQLARELQASLFMLYPNTSFLETSCMAAIEAMAAGCPVVTSSRGALPETVVDGKGGIVVPMPENPDRLVELLIQASLSLLKDETLLKRLSLSARKRAFDNYRWDTIAAQWMQQLKASTK